MMGRMQILLYHGVRPQKDLISADIRQKHVPEAAFRRQLAWLKRRGRCVSLDTVLAMLRGEEPWDKRAFAITFDDGYANNAELAAPILKEHGMTATFFLTTGFLDGTHRLWVDRFETTFNKLASNMSPKERAQGDTKLREQMKRVPVEERERVLRQMEADAGSVAWPDLYRAMTWDDARHLQQDGFTLGAHTITHPNLIRCSAEEQEKEIVTSKQRIEEETGKPCQHFAFPNGQPGDWSDETLAIISQAGFESCSTTVDGPVRRTSDPLLLPRLTIDSGDDFLKFRLTVNGWRSKLRRLKNVLR